MLRIEIRRPGGGEPLRIDVNEAHARRVTDDRAVVHVGDYELSISEVAGSDAIASQGKRERNRRSIPRDGLIAGLGLALMTVLTILDDRLSPVPHEPVVAITGLLGMIGIVASLCGLLSLANRALNGRFQFPRAARLIVEGLLGATLLLNDLLGLRWLVGGPLLYNEIYICVLIVFGAFMLWRIADFLLPLLDRRVRTIAAVVIGALLIFIDLKGLIPMKEKRRFLQRVAAPELATPFDRQEVDATTFTTRMDRLFKERP